MIFYQIRPVTYFYKFDPTSNETSKLRMRYAQLHQKSVIRTSQPITSFIRPKPRPNPTKPQSNPIMSYFGSGRVIFSNLQDVFRRSLHFLPYLVRYVGSGRICESRSRIKMSQIRLSLGQVKWVADGAIFNSFIFYGVSRPQFRVSPFCSSPD